MIAVGKMLVLSLATVSRWLKCRQVILLLLLIIAVGSFLRIYDPGAESVWFDEAASIHSAQQGIVQMLKDCATWQRHPPLHFFMLYLWIPVFGNSEIAVRSLSAIFGIISIFLVYRVGCQLFSKRVGLISSFILAISHFNIYYSQEVRAYSLLLMLTLLSFSLFITILKADDAKRSYFIYYFLANVLLVYTHYFGLFVIMSQIFYFILFWNKYRGIRKNFLYAQLATGIAFLPWAVIFIGYSIPRSWSWDQPTWSTIIATLSSYSGYKGGKAFLLPIFLFLCLLGLFSIKSLNGKWSWKKPLQVVKQLGSRISLEGETLLLLIWFFFPIGIPFLISQIPNEVTGIYSIRYTISASPAFYLLVANGFDVFTKRKALYPLLVVILITITGFSYVGLQDYYTHVEKAQWREAVSLVELHSRENDVIILNYGGSDFSMPFNYYYKGDLERSAIEQGREAQTIADFVVAGKQRMWFMQGPWGSTVTRDYLMENYGDDYLVMEEEFHGVSALLFDLSMP